ncbi:hypothetical protein [Herminiimonas sp. CN]|uniref:hypothetical protein n=1 Tax=Herminiimonas sp. CN TaxID=1349818 RepID=UPI0012DF4E09|nr:hypothetical protein [Herminiimonas sp. CN]
MVQYAHGGLPFGGANHSCIGSAHDRYGFKAFSHQCPVLRSRLLMACMFFPPYGKLTRRILNFMLWLL